MLREVQWRHFRNHSNWTPVHLYDTEVSEILAGVRRTICGKRFDVGDARIRGRDGNHDSALRGCGTCKRITAAKSVKKLESAAADPSGRERGRLS